MKKVIELNNVFDIVVNQDHQVDKVFGVHLEIWVHREEKASLEIKETMELLEFQEVQVDLVLGKKESLVNLEQLVDILDHPDQRAIKEIHSMLEVHLDQRVKLDGQVKHTKEKKVKWENLEEQLQLTTVFSLFQEYRVRRVLREEMDIQDRLVKKVNQDKVVQTGILEELDPQVRKVIKEVREGMEDLVMMDLLELQDHRDELDRKAQQDHLEDLVVKVSEVNQVKHSQLIPRMIKKVEKLIRLIFN